MILFDEWDCHYTLFSDKKLLLPIDEEDVKIKIVDAVAEEKTIPHDDNKPKPELNEEDLNATWYYHDTNRLQSEYLMVNHQTGNGSFLVRPSGMYPGNFALSLWWRNRIRHIRIKCQQKSKREGAGWWFYAIRDVFFNTLSGLVEYYKSYPIAVEGYEFLLVKEINKPRYANRGSSSQGSSGSTQKKEEEKKERKRSDDDSSYSHKSCFPMVKKQWYQRFQ